MKARELKPGMKIKKGILIIEVKRIIKITDKAITYRVKRIAPDYYDGDIFERNQLNTELTIIN